MVTKIRPLLVSCSAPGSAQPGRVRRNDPSGLALPVRYQQGLPSSLSLLCHYDSEVLSEVSASAAEWTEEWHGS